MNSRQQHSPPPAKILLPLYSLYEMVRDLDQQTGHQTVDLQSYLLLLETLMKGNMIFSKEQLVLLCEKLWMKPYHRHSHILNSVVLAKLLDEKLAVYLDADKINGDNTSRIKPTSPGSSFKDNQRKETIRKNNDIPPPSESDIALTKEQGELSLYISDSQGENVSSVEENENYVSKFLAKTYFTRGHYLPVNSRRLEQSIRSYRFQVKGGRKTEIDLEATIERIARSNFFDDFEYRSDDKFTTDWTLLIDNSDSMAAFYFLAEEITRVVTEGKRMNNDKILYFKDNPTTHLFYDRMQTRSISWPEFVARKKMNILIISDAGTARGTYNEDRIIASVNFLRQLKQHRVAWLNPMPQHRWKDTSAEMIAEFTDMFEPGEGDKDGLANIVRLFKSKIRSAKTNN